MATSLTMVEVAREAGVSLGTVSRVINRHPRVSPENTTAVRTAMASLGYQPPPPKSRRGPRAKALRQTGGHVALLLVGPRNLQWTLEHAPVYAHVLHGVEAALARLDKILIVRHVPNYENVPEAILDGLAGGLIFFGFDPGIPMPPRLAQIPSIWAMGRPRNFPGDHILPNHQQTGILAAEHLCRSGHGNFAVIGPIEKHVTFGPSINDRARAFCETAEQRGRGVLALLDESLICPQSREIDESRLTRLIDQFMSASPRPNGLFVMMDQLAPGIYRHLALRGLRPGSEIAVVTCNNERPYLAGLAPQPAVVDIRADYIGQRTVERLLWRIDNPDKPAETIQVHPRLIEA